MARKDIPDEMSPAESKSADGRLCPLCGQPNDCQLCTEAAFKRPCWCFSLKVPEELIAQVPPEFKNKACICKACVMKFNREKAVRVAPSKILPGDFYFENGLLVLKATFLLRRGFCCDSGCRHCPF